MSTKLFLIASSLLTVMSCINVGHASNDNSQQVTFTIPNNTAQIQQIDSKVGELPEIISKDISENKKLIIDKLERGGKDINQNINSQAFDIKNNIFSNNQEINKYGKNIIENISDFRTKQENQNTLINKNIENINSNINRIAMESKTILNDNANALQKLGIDIKSAIKLYQGFKEQMETEYQQKSENLTSTINKLNIEIAELTEKNKTHIDDLSKEKTKHINDIKQKQNQINGLTKKYETLIGKYRHDKLTLENKYSKQIQELKKKYNEYSEKLENKLGENTTALKRNVEILNEYIDTMDRAQNRILNNIYTNASNIVGQIARIQSDVTNNKKKLDDIVKGFTSNNKAIEEILEQNKQTIQKLEGQYNEEKTKLTNKLAKEKKENLTNKEKIEQITTTYNYNILNLKTKHITAIAKMQKTCNAQITELQNKYRNDCLITQQVLTNNSLALKEQTGKLGELITQNNELNEYLHNQFGEVNQKLDNLNSYNINKERNKIVKNLSLTLIDKNEQQKIEEEYNTYVEHEQIKFLEPTIKLLYIKIVNSANDFNRKLGIYAGNNLTTFNIDNVKQIINKLETCIKRSINNNIDSILNMLQNIDRLPNTNIFKPTKVLPNNSSIKREKLRPVQNSHGSTSFDKVPTLKQDLDTLEKLAKNEQYNHVQLMYKLLKSIVKQSEDIVKKQNNTHYFTSDDFKEDITLLCDSLKQYLDITHEWNESLNTAYFVQEYELIQQGDGYKYEDDIFYKYWFNTCIKYCFGNKKKERNINDIYHAVKCVLYERMAGTKDLIKNDELREYVNNCVKDLFDGNNRIAVLFDRLISNCEFQQAENADSDYEGNTKDMKVNKISYDKNKNILNYKIRGNNPQFVIKNKITLNRNNNPQNNVYSRKTKLGKDNIDQKLYKLDNKRFSSESSDSYSEF